jgi:hypothetical protein
MKPCDPTADNRIEELLERYGLVFPSEYLEFGAVHGTGGFVGEDTHEIFVSNPFSRHFFDKVEDGQDVLDFFLSEEGIEEDLFNHDILREQLFPLGDATSDGHLFWITTPNPEEWQILLTWPEDAVFEIFNVGLTRFLVNYFTSQVVVQLWQQHMVHGGTQAYSFCPPDVC